MAKLQVTNPAPLRAVQDPEELLLTIGKGSTLEEELDAMVTMLIESDPYRPELILSVCMGLMSRCTEIYLRIVRAEGEHRRLKAFRTMQLQRVMDLIDFEFRGASRLIEVRRQEVELSK